MKLNAHINIEVLILQQINPHVDFNHEWIHKTSGVGFQLEP